MEDKFNENAAVIKTSKIALIHILEIIANLMQTTERYHVHIHNNEMVSANITN